MELAVGVSGVLADLPEAVYVLGDHLARQHGKLPPVTDQGHLRSPPPLEDGHIPRPQHPPTQSGPHSSGCEVVSSHPKGFLHHLLPSLLPSPVWKCIWTAQLPTCPLEMLRISCHPNSNPTSKQQIQKHRAGPRRVGRVWCGRNAFSLLNPTVLDPPSLPLPEAPCPQALFSLCQLVRAKPHCFSPTTNILTSRFPYCE